MVKFPLVATLVLCACSSILAAPLPRIIAPRATSSSLGHWELRPSPNAVESRQAIELALQSWADPHFYSYVRGTFDPERPYIQVVLPSGEEEDDDLTRTQGKTKYYYIDKEVNPIKDVTVNNTRNDTNTTDGGSPNTIGQSPNASAEEQENGAERLPFGTYELAYVAHRRRGTARRYPLVQYADYQVLGQAAGWSVWGEPQALGPLYEPVYIYRPVYPSRYHDYDVLYYVPASEDEGAEKADNNELEKEASEIAMPDAEHDVTVQIAMPEAEQEVTVQKDPADDPSEDSAVADEEGAVTEEEDNLEQALARGESEQQSNDSPVKGPITSQSVEVKETAEVEEESESPTIDWEKELENISDEDLLMAVEGVLQRLHNRLTD